MFNTWQRYKNNPAIIYNDKLYNYSELESFAKLLQNHIGQKELVVHLTCSSFESIGAYVGLLKNRSVQLLLEESIEKNFLQNILESYKPKYIYLPKTREISSEYKKVLELDEYILVQTHYETNYEISEDLALLLSTSGSTGTPKFVRQSFTNITTNADSIIEYLQIDSSCRTITSLPTNYTFMLSIINTYLMSGACVVALKESIMQKEFWQTLQQHKVSSLSGVPFTFEMLKKLKFNKMQLPSLQTITQAGGKLSNELIEYFYETSKKHGVKFIVMYGQTEATARMSYLPYNKLPQKIGSIGVAIPNTKIWLEDEKGIKITTPNAEGELIYSGANVTLGYANGCHDLAKEDENQGILHTGDIAKFDEDGYFYITGRKKRFVKIYGNRINLDELEKIAHLHKYESVIVGDDTQITIYAMQDIKEQIVTLLAKTIKQNKKIFRFVKVEQILRNSAGKVLYKEMQNVYR